MIHALPILDSASFAFDEYHRRAIGELDRAAQSHFTIWRFGNPRCSGSEHKKLRSPQLVEWDAEGEQTWLREISGGTEVEYRAEQMMQARELLEVPDDEVPCLAFFTQSPGPRPVGRLRIVRTWFDSDQSWRKYNRDFCGLLKQDAFKRLCEWDPAAEDLPKRLGELLGSFAAQSLSPAADMEGIEVVGPRLRRSDLTPSRAALLQLMRQLDFGHIEKLVVENGEPVVDPRPRVFIEVKLAEPKESRSVIGVDDCFLGREQVRLFELLEACGNGVISRIEVRYGLPFRLIAENAPRLFGHAMRSPRPGGRTRGKV